jgi:hypothetical protein
MQIFTTDYPDIHGWGVMFVILSEAKDPAERPYAGIILDVEPACWLDFTSLRMTG